MSNNVSNLTMEKITMSKFKIITSAVVAMSISTPSYSANIPEIDSIAIESIESYPGDVAFSIDGGVRAFPSGLPIYTYADDLLSESTCYFGCIGAWSPLLASIPNNYTVGYWTQIVRKDNRIQWAYKGHPIYTHFGDNVNLASGHGAEGGKWNVVTVGNTGKVIVANYTK